MWRKIAAALVAVQGLFCLIGGWIGMARAGSWVSLIVGGVSCAILGPAAWSIWKGRRAAAYVALLLSLLLDLRFARAFMMQHKVMPHLVIVVLSSLAIVATGLALLKKEFRPASKPEAETKG
jgi:uncharacterized membrane protein (UPF0136 family)